MYIFLCADLVQVLKAALQEAGKLQNSPNPSFANHWGLLCNLDGESIQGIT